MIPLRLAAAAGFTILGTSVCIGACSSGRGDDAHASGGSGDSAGAGGSESSGGTGSGAGGSSGGTGGAAGDNAGGSAAHLGGSGNSSPTIAETLGEPGWRNSTDPLCLSDSSLRGGSVELALDSEGLLLRYGVNCDPTTLDADCGYTTHLLRNHGDGWTDVYGPDDENAIFDLQVLSDNDFLLRSNRCAAVWLKDGSLGECELAHESYDLTAVSPERTFSLLGEEVWKRSDDGWAHWANLPGLANRIFATDDLLLTVAPSLISLQDGTGQFQALPSAGSERYYVDAYALAKNDVWVWEGDGSLLHFDGESWTEFPIASEGWSGQLFGIGGALYFLTTSVLGTVQDGEPRILFEVDQTEDSTYYSLKAAAGRSPSELFVAVGVRGSNECGNIGVLFFDGEELHAF